MTASSNTDYIFAQRRHYKAVMSSQNRIQFFIAIHVFFFFFAARKEKARAIISVDQNRNSYSRWRFAPVILAYENSFGFADFQSKIA